MESSSHYAYKEKCCKPSAIESVTRKSLGKPFLFLGEHLQDLAAFTSIWISSKAYVYDVQSISWTEHIVSHIIRSHQTRIRPKSQRNTFSNHQLLQGLYSAHHGTKWKISSALCVHTFKTIIIIPPFGTQVLSIHYSNKKTQQKKDGGGALTCSWPAVMIHTN